MAEHVDIGIGNLYEQYRDRLYVHALNLLGDEMAAEDIVGDVFALLAEHPERLMREKNVKGFLFVMVRNRCIDAIRHEKVVRKNETEFVRELFESMTETDYEAYDGRIAAMQANLEQLAPKMRAVLEAFYFQRKHYKEIADELEMSPNTARKHVMRAIKILRERMTFWIFF